MYSILKSVINAGNKPIDMLTHKVEAAWANGSITDEEKMELDDLIFKKKNPETESPTLAQLYDRLQKKVEGLEKEVVILREKISGLVSENQDPVEPEKTEISIQEWEPWDGISSNYQEDAIVKHIGKIFLNMLKGMQNTWEPGSPGIDERYWKEITYEEAVEILTQKDSEKKSDNGTPESDLDNKEETE